MRLYCDTQGSWVRVKTEGRTKYLKCSTVGCDGSAKIVGPAAYVVTAGDLNTATAGYSICKFADDTYLIISARNEVTRHAELVNIQALAERNNLRLNFNKSALSF